MANEQNMSILAIETSCDETSAAVVVNGRRCVSNIISSQIDTHRVFGGVVPEIASRKHIETISLVVDQAMAAATTEFLQLSGVAVTNGPGLIGALVVGLYYAKSLAYGLRLPLITVNHLHAHICANYLEDITIEGVAFEPPFMCLVVSGGHTSLVYVEDYLHYEFIGQTRDDAAGEAFDKVARTLGLPYPGGPEIEKLAAIGNPHAIQFPRANTGKGTTQDFDFSFSGLKSAVLNYLNKASMQGVAVSREDVAASFQAAVIDVLVDKCLAAAAHKGCGKVALAGGVAASTALRQKLSVRCAEQGVRLNLPPKVFCTDNAAMVASAAYYRYLAQEFAPLDVNAYSRNQTLMTKG
ncbi:MAG: tRNA (adenosine(37)-N6)-threonylcarbamoyltransferase complex transferase subunit TsaD [Defluviitaleaceae bacterium]|nr:tRNA (adenosine(37)-N6)-threonylcarbamoyltransferase complex transferase subunit TsaD [Defluviitaleaceae bacterium]